MDSEDGQSDRFFLWVLWKVEVFEEEWVDRFLVWILWKVDGLGWVPCWVSER